MKNQRFNPGLVLAMKIVMAGVMTGLMIGPTIGYAQQQELANVEDSLNLQANSAPVSDQHQCYARVSVPAEYRSEEVEVELVPEKTRFKITPPIFKDSVETVDVSPVITETIAVQPVLEETTQEFEVLPSTELWVRDSLTGKQPLTEGELLDLGDWGVGTDKVPTGTCLKEYFFEATLEDIPTKVMVSEASEKLIVVDEVIEDDVVSVTTEPAFTRIVEVPPSLKKSEDRILIAEATKRWETQCGALEQVDHMTGETLCLVDVPAEYSDLAVEVIDTPALLTNVDREAKTTEVKIKTKVSDAEKKREVIPATYESLDRQRVAKPARYSWHAESDKIGFGAKFTGRTACYVEQPAKVIEYTRQVVKTPGRFDEKTVPAETTTINIKTLVSEAVSLEYTEPAKVQKIERQILVSPSKIEWKPVLCQANFSEDIIAQLQNALSKRGYEPGPTDGIMGLGTANAIREFQKDNKLADGGLTIELYNGRPLARACRFSL